MKHSKIIAPRDSSLTPADAIPDRSNLSELYLASKNKRQIVTNEHESIAQPPNEPRPTAVVNRVSQIQLSLLLTIPTGVTYLAAVIIYQGTATSVTNPDPLFPLVRFFVSAVWLIACLISIRAIRKYFYTYDVSFGMFIPIYLFYLLPLLSITYDLFATDYFGMILTVALWLGANCFIVPYIFWSLSRCPASVTNKAVWIALPIVALIICAIMF